jgi:MFS family permease
MSFPREREPLLQPSATNQIAERRESSPSSTNKFSAADLYWILAGTWSGVFLSALDGTVVATLLTPIGGSFNKFNQSSYIGTSYLLSVCCFTPLYGRLSDIIGRKGALLTALTFFGSGTILCGLAPSMGTLIVARAIAGIGGGGIMTVSSITVTDLIPLKQRGLYQGMANIVYGLGAGLGGPLGGWISDSLGWSVTQAFDCSRGYKLKLVIRRAAFLLQIPILIFSFALVVIKVNIELPFDVQNQSLSDRLRRIDFFGSLTLVGTVGCLLLGFSLKSTEELSWSNPLIWGLFVASGIFGVLFILVESRWAPYPVMPLRLISQRTPLAVSLSNLLGSISAFSMVRVALSCSKVIRESLNYSAHPSCTTYPW